MNKQASFFGKVWAWLKERVRRFFVMLKKKPDLIPIAALLVSFLVYSLNLTSVSNTTAKIYGANMGLCSFVTMLLMILSFVVMLGAYPKRQKPNWLKIALMTLMYLIVIAADILYYNRIEIALTREENPIAITADTMYIWEAQNLMVTHIITVVIIIVLIYLEPLLAKLIRKINTNIDVEASEVEKIELSEDE